MTWDILLLTILLLFSIVVSLSEICGIGSDDAYFAVFGNACLMIMSILYCCTISEEEVGLLQRLSRYCLTAALMATFYALTFFLPDVWSITAVMVLLAIISPVVTLSDTDISIGRRVARGDTIGAVAIAPNGLCTLHLEIWNNGQPVDPHNLTQDNEYPQR